MERPAAKERSLAGALLAAVAALLLVTPSLANADRGKQPRPLAQSFSSEAPGSLRNSLGANKPRVSPRSCGLFGLPSGQAAELAAIVPPAIAAGTTAPAPGQTASYAETRYRVTTTPAGPRDWPEAALSRFSCLGYDDSSSAEVVGSLDAAGSGALSRGAQLRLQYGEKFGEYVRHRGQGFTPAQSKYLAEPYFGAGHHFPIRQAMGRRLSLPQKAIDFPLNVLKPGGMTRGRFYELHFRVDPTFYGTAFPPRIGGVWRGQEIGLQKLTGFSKVWSATPGPLKLAAGAAGAGAAAGSLGWYLSDDE